VSPNAVLNIAELPKEAVGLISIKLLAVSCIKVAVPPESDWEILPSKSIVEEDPLVIETGTSAVVTDQEVKAAIVDVLGLEVDELDELFEVPPPPQALKKITLITMMK